MGLDFSHCNARWAYSGFMRFRTRLAAEIGIKDLMQIYMSDNQVWPKDDIVLLLDHSDCEGDLSPEDCVKVAPRIRELVSKWPDDDYDKIKALELADGMELAAKNGEPLIFC